ncbi:MAG: hypothetical protein ACPK85_00790 [Methanosarcina sp.]
MRDTFKLFNLDPEKKYPSEGLRRVEANAERILIQLPESTIERTRDCIQIDYGGEEGIIILVTPETIELRLPTVEWTMGSYGPVASSRLWKRVEVSEITDRELETLLKETLKECQKQFKNCRSCKKRFRPEHMHGDVCHACAEKHLGVVH